MKKKEIIVIGGGASGMMAAIAASSKDSEVLLLEQKDRVGKKLLSTGNGKCNLTNSCQESWCYRGDDVEFPFQSLALFSEKDTRKFFEDLGILLKEKNGYWYPRWPPGKTFCANLL